MNKQSGFSLVELMIATTLGLIVITAVSSIFLSSNKTNKTQENMARLQENARFALNKMQTDIRMAGYRGCLGRKGSTAGASPTLVTNVISGSTYADDLALSLQGFNATAATWSPTLDSAIAAAIPAPTAGSDIISVRMGTGSGTPLTALMASGSATIAIAANPDNLAIGDTALIADCVTSTVFKVTGISATSIAHSTATNTTANLGRAFDIDAVVMPTATVTYYVAPSADLTNGLSLWRKTNASGSEELVDNVEQLKIIYGEDTNGDIAPDKYVSADQVTNMNNVIAVKLMLLTRTTDDKLSNNGQNYTFNGALTTPPDKRIRRAFNLVITLRNRAA